MILVERTADFIRPIVRGLDVLSPLASLALRLWVAKVFFYSGLTKIQNFDVTISLFTDEYQVPVLSPAIAAYSATAAELILPVLLVLGLGGRFAAIALFVFNAVAVISYPDLNEVGIGQHQVWGLMLFVLALQGPGKWSVDHHLRRRWMP